MLDYACVLDGARKLILIARCQHLLISLDDIMDEILVSVVFLIVCTYEIAEKVRFVVLNSTTKLCRSV